PITAGLRASCHSTPPNDRLPARPIDDAHPLFDVQAFQLEQDVGHCLVDSLPLERQIVRTEAIAQLVLEQQPLRYPDIILQRPAYFARKHWGIPMGRIGLFLSGADLGPSDREACGSVHPNCILNWHWSEGFPDDFPSAIDISFDRLRLVP